MDEYYALNDARWRVSSYSSAEQNTCVEVAPLPWRISSYSSAGENTCVEVAPAPGAVGIRDTKDRDRGHLIVGRATWASFVSGIKDGRA